MKLEKVKMPEQLPEIRNKNFNEVSLGYNKEEAIEEAQRCLNCKHKPCVIGCPVGVPIPEFIEKAAKGDFKKAFEIIYKANSLPAVCGRVCPQENQCEGLCVCGKKGEPIAIGRLERFCADYYLENGQEITTEPIKSSHLKVAVIGAGPAGLSCAGELAKLGYKVTVFEAFHTAGGVLVYGIPEFRLPKKVVKAEVSNLIKMGVEIKTNMVIGKILSIDELFEMGFKACFIGSGAGLPVFPDIQGTALKGVYSANEYLTRINLMKAYDSSYDTPVLKSKKVAVIGGGNVAMDAARSALRIGAEKVYIIYRRSKQDMPARQEEIHHAEEEGVIFTSYAIPIRIIPGKSGEVIGVECLKTTPGQVDGSGRQNPVIVENSNFILETDTVIAAIGTTPNPLFGKTENGLETDKRGCLVVNPDTLETTKKGVYAGGDAVTGAATVILAMGAGKKAAGSIHKYIIKSSE